MSGASVSPGANQTGAAPADAILSIIWLPTAHQLSASPASAVLAVAVALVTLVYLIYQQALPKPLPGIPYNPASAHRLLGDLPMLFPLVRDGDLRSFFGTLTQRVGSPMVQFFGRPFGRPVIVLSDFRATQDILLRRTKEFDRPLAQVEALRGVIPNHHIAMLTTDPQFRKNRALVKDLMTPNFLHAVNAPEIWRNAVHFVDVWRFKARVARGRPFEAAQDVEHMTFDTIKNVAVGRDGHTMMEMYMDQLRSQYSEAHSRADADDDDNNNNADDKKEAEFVFPQPPADDTLEAQHRMNEALTPRGAGIAIPMKVFHAINNRRPYMRKAYASKENMLRRQVAAAVRRHEANEPLDSALDFMIRREMGAAQKEGRAPVFDSPAMFDELYGYLGAGHDTTATTFAWGLKHLAQEPHVQQRARAALRATYAEAHQQGRPPSVAEITRTQVPYLEAVIEEILRLSGPVSAAARSTTTDTVIMGHAVPKGTTVFMAIYGPGITLPSVPVPQQAAAVAADKEHKEEAAPYSFTARDNWDDMDPEKFMPERWLRKDDDGKVVYDAQAGPMLAFSLGLRGCFGRRLAYLTMRIMFTMLIWHFELEAVPSELDSWRAKQVLTRKPTQCYVKLRMADGLTA